MIEEAEYFRKKSFSTKYICECRKEYEKSHKFYMHALESHFIDVKSFKANY